MTEVPGAGLSDRVNVGGTATLGGTGLVVALPGMAFAPSHHLHILNATGGLSGTFALVNELYPFLQSNLSYDANNVYLTLATGGFAAAAPRRHSDAWATCSMPTSTTPPATSPPCWAPWPSTRCPTRRPRRRFRRSRPKLFRLLDLDGPGRAALHEQLRQPDRRRRLPCSNRVALAEACDVACDSTTPPQWGAWAVHSAALARSAPTSRSAASPTTSAASRRAWIAW